MITKKLRIIKFTGFILSFLLPVLNTMAQTSPFVVSDPKKHTEVIDTSYSEYSILLNGTVDMDNTATSTYSNYEVAFQPNISVEIENIGSVPVIDPWLVINGKRDWFNIDRMVIEITKEAIDEQDKLMLIYEFARSHRYHNPPVFIDEELHDPVKYFNSYGAGLCDQIAYATNALVYKAGFNKEKHGGDPKVRQLHGHAMSEICVNGQYQFIDTDENAFYLDPTNTRPASGDEIAADADIASRDHSGGPLFSSMLSGEEAAGLFGRDDGATYKITFGHEMNLTLRPGEKLTLRWDNINVTPGFNTEKIYGDTPRTKELKYFANSFLDYHPKMDTTFLNNLYDYKNIVLENEKIYGTSADSYIIVEVKSPYVIGSGEVEALFEYDSKSGKPSIAVSIDGKQWTEIWNSKDKTSLECKSTIDETLDFNSDHARYKYYIRINIGSEEKDICLKDFQVQTVLLTNPIALPRLSLGNNKIVYTDKSNNAGEVRITHTYQESNNIIPPLTPKIITPENSDTITTSSIQFTWAKVEDAAKYHFRVSRRSDLRTSYRPTFDLLIDDTTFTNPRTGLFNPGENYYWSVRARNEYGVWGEWCFVQTFSWDGPTPPLNLKSITEDGKIFLTWEPNPSGRKPVQYEVYASDIKGFKPSKVEHNIVSLGMSPSNIVTVTTDNKIVIVSDEEQAPNKSSYRVIAVDDRGAQSGSSQPLELPHPLIYGKPPLTAKVGSKFEYKVLTLKSMGDIQFRYVQPRLSFWEKEGYEFSLEQAPDWMKIDSETGVITGIPGEIYAGKNIDVVVNVKRTYPQELKDTVMYYGKVKKNTSSFLKRSAEYQANDKQRFTINVEL